MRPLAPQSSCHPRRSPILTLIGSYLTRPRRPDGRAFGETADMPFPDEPFAEQVRVLPHQPRVAEEGADLVARLRRLLPDGAAVEHIGSTSIPSKLAKDWIDAMVRVRSLATVRSRTILGVIRTPRSDELCTLRDVEASEMSPFRTLGMCRANYEPTTATALAAIRNAGGLWVVTDRSDRPVGSLQLRCLDGNAHVDQLSVLPAHAHQRLGKQLVEAAASWAQIRRHPALTLSTYADIPWNAPYYERLGFQALSDDQLTPGLRRNFDRNVASGLAAWPRVTMQLLLDGL